MAELNYNTVVPKHLNLNIIDNTSEISTTTSSFLSIESSNNTRTCKRCKRLLYLTDFRINRTGQYNILCNRCLDSRKCPHDKKKKSCKICTPTFTPHMV